MKRLLMGLLGYTFVSQQVMAQTDSIANTYELKNVVVKATKGIKSRNRVDNVDIIGQGQLIRAACCNLGESFTANPSVDVSYSDATTGAKQIKLLGLSGTYVQMLTENVPNLRGAALPYSLGYVPGPWMQSIQVSKGASSVKNGYESTTGQINIEFLKPQGIDGVRANVYQDSELKKRLISMEAYISQTDFQQPLSFTLRTDRWSMTETVMDSWTCLSCDNITQMGVCVATMDQSAFVAWLA